MLIKANPSLRLYQILKTETFEKKATLVGEVSIFIVVLLIKYSLFQFENTYNFNEMTR